MATKKSKQHADKQLMTLMIIVLSVLAVFAGTYMVTSKRGEFTQIQPKAKGSTNPVVENLTQDFTADLDRIDRQLNGVSQTVNTALPASF